MAETLLEELKRYVGFSAEDEASLRGLVPGASPHFGRITDVFYRRILEHEGARKALEGGESQVGHLKVTLQVWLGKLLQGPWDEAYFELRSRIGRVHVRIALPQHYMFGAMNVIRSELFDLIDSLYAGQQDLAHRARSAVGKVLDLELAIMLHTFREDLLIQQAKSERLSTFGQLVGSIGHELRNPLGVIETSLFILKGRIGTDERSIKHVERIGDQLGIANHIISDLLDMIRDRALVRERVVLAEVLESAAGDLSRPETVTLELAGIAGLPPVNGDSSQLRQVFLNLLQNAVQATEPRGRVRVVGSVQGRSVRIAIEDTGPGVDPSVRRRLFEPLVTTKDKGIGLGLALVRRIVERHEGSIAYEPPPSGGAAFVVLLPALGTP
jgi:two-component system, NtrC family, sensor histidine kinase HydH